MFWEVAPLDIFQPELNLPYQIFFILRDLLTFTHTVMGFLHSYE